MRSTYDYNQIPVGFGKLNIEDKNLKLKRLFDIIEGLNFGKILEIGTGGGHYISAIKKVCPKTETHGVDINQVAIQFAKGNSKVPVLYTIGDALSLPYKSDSFDCLLALDVLEHMSDVPKAIREIFRVLKRNGLLHIYLPCEKNRFTLTWAFHKIRVGRNLTKRHFGHLQYLTTEEIRKFLISGGFCILKESYSDHLLSQILHFFSLHLPREILSLLGERVSHFCQDNRDYLDIGRKKNLSWKLRILRQLKYFWLLLVSKPVRIIAYYEGEALKNFSFTARGVHITAKKTT